MHVVVCLKWVDHRPEIDPLSGVVTTDHRFSGASPADRAALEWSLRLTGEIGGTVTAVTCGPAEATPMLRDALAVGAEHAVLVDDDPGGLASERVASLLAPVCADADLVVCGLHSLDRGSGSVPAYLAHVLGVPQALGLVAATASAAPTTGPTPIEVVRRLDEGRRERLRVTGRCVLSFEGGVELRRGSLTARLASRTAAIERHRPPAIGAAGHNDLPADAPDVVAIGPYRPRAKVLPAPTGSTRQRVAELVATDAGEGGPSTVQELPPDEAAELVVDRLVEWGYLTSSPDGSGGEGVNGS